MTLKTDQEVISLMQALGDQRVSENNRKLREAGQYSRTSPGSFLVGSMAGRLAEAVEAWMNSNSGGRGMWHRNGVPPLRLRITEAIDQLGLTKACLLASGYVMDMLMREHGTVDRYMLRNGLGKILHDEMRMSCAAEVSTEKFRYVRRYLTGPGVKHKNRIFNFLVDEMNPEERDLVHCWEPIVQDGLALVLLVHLVKVSGIIDTVTFQKKARKKAVHLFLKPSTLDVLVNAR